MGASDDAIKSKSLIGERSESGMRCDVVYRVGGDTFFALLET